MFRAVLATGRSRPKRAYRKKSAECWPIILGMTTEPSHHLSDNSDDGPAKARVLLAEDDVLLREGLASLLERSGFEVVGQTGDARGFLPLVRELTPDLVMVDIRMPPTHTTEGLDAAREIREEFPAIGILVLSAHVEVEHAMELLASGQRIGYLLKSRVTDVDEFIETLERIAKGGFGDGPRAGPGAGERPPAQRPARGLSPREQEVLALMAEGRSNAGIARRLWVTEGTVEKHVRSILAKLSLPETDDDHRRVLAVVTFLEAADGLAAVSRDPSRSRMAPADSLVLGKNPAAGLAAIRSA